MTDPKPPSPRARPDPMTIKQVITNY